MQTVIFGRPGCPYCVRAKDLAEKLSNERDDFQYQYVDIRAEGITKEDLQQKAGKPVETVPQIFVDQQHIGGYTDFAAWVKEWGKTFCHLKNNHHRSGKHEQNTEKNHQNLHFWPRKWLRQRQGAAYRQQRHRQQHHSDKFQYQHAFRQFTDRAHTLPSAK